MLEFLVSEIIPPKLHEKLINQLLTRQKKKMRHLALLLCAIGCVLALPPQVLNSDVTSPPAELCQPWVCRTPACKCTSTDSGGSFPVEKTPQV